MPRVLITPASAPLCTILTEHATIIELDSAVYLAGIAPPPLPMYTTVEIELLEVPLSL